MDVAGQAHAEAPLSQDDPKPVAGEVRADGLVYSVNPDGESVSLAGWYGSALDGDVVVPSEISSGGYPYAVTQIGVLDADGRVSSVFEGASPTSVSIPESVETMPEGALSGCPSLARISVSPKNETFASFDGMLFSKDLSSLLLVPAGKEGAALLPDPADAVPAGAFSRCSRLPAVRVGEGSVAFSSRNGILYSKDMKTLVACPPGAGGAVVVPDSVEAIADGAFAGCGVASITVLGDVREIAAGAFDEAARAEAVVALPGGEDYAARRAAWEAAGFARFAEPARPGDVSAPEAPEGEGEAPQASGLAYEVLDDYTLAASWAGPEGPSGELAIPATAEVGGASYRVSAVADAGFAGCSALTGVQLPAGLASVGERAFEACGLAELWLPASVESVGSRALAACPSLARVVALGAIEAAPDALAEDAGASLYCPAGSEGSWNPGLPAAGNHLMPYGASLAEEPLRLEEGQTASLLDGGQLLAPEPVEVSYSYAAKPLSVDADGVAAGKAAGSSEVSVALTLDGVELARAARAVEVTAASQPAPQPEPERESGEPKIESLSLEADAAIAPISLAEEPVNELVRLSTGIFFEAEVPSGQTLKFEVLDQDKKTVSVARSDDVAKRPTGDLAIPETVTDDSGVTYTVTEVADSGFFDLKNNLTIASVTLPETLEVLRKGSFAWCNLTGVLRIPASVNSIENNPFTGNLLLEAIEVDADSKEYFSDENGALFTKDMKRLIAIPGGFKGHFEVPESVELLTKGVADTCVGLVSVTLPKGLKVIETQAFQNCAQLTSVSIPEGITSLGYGAFQGSSVSSIVLPSTVKSVGQRALSCETMKEVLCLSASQLTTVHADALEKRDPSCVVHCSESVVGKWQPTGAFATAFATGAPETFTIPSNRSVEMAVAPSIPVGSAFSTKIECDSSDESIASIESIGANEDGAQVFRVVPKKSTGSCTVKAKLMFSGGADDIELASSDTTVSVIAPHGALPTASNEENADEAAAGWTLDEDGLLTIRSTEPVADFKWEPGSREMLTQHWGSLRAAVKKVDTTFLTGTKSMDCWFQDMINLSDISEAKLPDGVESLANAFAGTGVVSIPETFAIPESVTNLRSAFNACTLLTAIPETFVLPNRVENIGYLFGFNPNLADLPESFRIPASVKNIEGFFCGWTSLTAVPENFSSPDLNNVVDADCLFCGCTSLSGLPEGFSALRNATSLDDAFGNCTSLTALPEGFSIPSAKSCNYLFRGCSSLAALPRSFELPDTVTSASAMFARCTSLISLPDGFAIPDGAEHIDEMFAGCASLLKLPDEFSMPAAAKANASIFRMEGAGLPMYYGGSDPDVTEYVWSQANRTFVGSSKPADSSKSVTFNVKAKDEPGGDVWYKAYTDAEGMLAEPTVAPTRPGYVFTLWYADEACTQRVDFSQPFAKDATLYGVLASGSFTGTMGTTDGADSAFWSITEAGTLYLRGPGMVNIMMPDLDEGSGIDRCWWPYRDQVRKIVMCPSLDALYTHNWFRGMKNLVDASEAFIPKSATILHRMFEGCIALATLPEGFTVPDNVENMASMFRGCKTLRTLPSTFFFSESSAIDDLSYAFFQCVSLASLPERFTLPSSMSARGLEGAFDDCPSLVGLPDGFEVPEGADGTHVFRCAIGENEPRVATYYAGSNRSVLGFDWESQNRTLVTSDADMGERGMRQVKLKVQKPDEAAGFPWETRSVAWTNKQGILADPGAPQLDGYTFSGWCTDEACLDPVDFSRPMPEGADALYGKWAVAGGCGTAEGALPVDGNMGSAWWSLTADGALNIKCEGGASVSNLNMTWVGADETYWQPYRGQVVSLNMDPDVRAQSVQAWFRGMERLVDVRNGFHFPSNCETAQWLFYGCTSLRFLPEGFFPEANKVLASVAGMLQNCSSFESLPADFLVPDTVKTTGFMLSGTSIEALPEKFSLPKGLDDMSQMFRGCGKLKSLPEDFVIPSSAYGLKEVFVDCPALDVLPSKLLSEVADERAKSSMNDGKGMFGFNPGTVHDKPLTTYFAAPSAEQDLVRWQAQDRIVVSDVPDGRCMVGLWLPNEDGADFYLWKQLMTVRGDAIDEPVPAARVGSSFVGWYTDPLFETPAKFPMVATGSEALYAKYIATSGSLPTVDAPDNDNPEIAGWALSADGTLRISCEPGEVIGYLGWNHADASFSEGKWNTGYWGPLRNEVRSISIDAGTSAVNMNCWFAEMHNLADISGLVVPTQVEELRRTFFRCTSLAKVPEGFIVPDGVKCVSDMFAYCSDLSELPSGFALPSTVTTANHLFDSCAKLELLPASFLLCEGVEDVRCMFIGCASLRKLPTGFALPSTASAANGFVNGCSSLEALPSGFTLPTGVGSLKEFAKNATSLKSLPAGFSIPAGATNVTGMFEGCSALESLPEGFEFEDAATVTDVTSMFGGCVSLRSLPSTLDLRGLVDASGIPTMFGGLEEAGYGPGKELATYYAGDGLSSLGPSDSDPAGYWSANYGRALFTVSEKPEGVKTVSFVTIDPKAGESAAWMTVVTEGGRIVEPADPVLYGYAFDGWYTDASFAADSKFAFAADGTASVANDTVLYGRYVLRMSYDIPLFSKVVIDAAGNVTGDDVEVVSFTPKALVISSASVAEAPGASKLFPNAGERSRVKVGVGFKGGASCSLALGEEWDLPLGKVPPATPTAPGVLGATLSVERNGAQINYQPGDDVTSFAKLTWTVEAAAS